MSIQPRLRWIVDDENPFFCVVSFWKNIQKCSRWSKAKRRRTQKKDPMVEIPPPEGLTLERFPSDRSRFGHLISKLSRIDSKYSITRRCIHRQPAPSDASQHRAVFRMEFWARSKAPAAAKFLTLSQSTQRRLYHSSVIIELNWIELIMVGIHWNAQKKNAVDGWMDRWCQSWKQNRSLSDCERCFSVNCKRRKDRNAIQNDVVRNTFVVGYLCPLGKESPAILRVG